MIGLNSKEEKSPKKVVILVPRWIKTLFFLITMLLSLLLFSAPIFVVIADSLLPSFLLSASLSQSLTMRTISTHLNNYDFRYSLIDIPLLSIIRSAIILCVYSLCDGPKLSRGPYLGIVTACTVVSLVYVSMKGSYVLMMSTGGGYVKATEVALLVCSFVLAIGHVVVAYKTSCKEKRKLLLYKIDIESVSACNKGFHKYQKIIIQQARTK